MKRAFTLIELLIVVAIIAILAAITVPNFLEAQTRAKVSRAMADMRTIATAIEAYTVDYNRPAPDTWDWLDMGRYVSSWDCLLWPLTTPVAYMTSIPPDPFARRSLFELLERASYAFYTTRTGWGNDLSSGGYNNPADPAALFYGPRSNYKWVLDSAGPDLWWEWQRAPALPQEWAGDVIYYDATNGSKSQGDIYYYGPGGGINPAPVTCR